MSERINCIQCKHYYATYDSFNPRGCRFYGFTSPHIPAQVVQRESKTPCQAYEQRKCFKDKEKKKPVNFNDAKYW